MNVLLTLSSFIFPLITFPYITRVLLPSGTGRISFATSLISYFTLLSQLGIPIYGVRECAKVRDDEEELAKLTKELLLISIITAAFSYILLVICIISIPRLWCDRKLIIVVSANILFNAIGVEWLYKGLRRVCIYHN